MHATYYRPGGVYRDLPDTDARVPESRSTQRKELKRQNAARDGSLLDFIEDFTNRSRTGSTSTKLC